MTTINLGILAHVDAGKTSLTERLLYAAGVIDTLGSVDGGDTQTDTLALERRRGITLKSAVVSFDVAGVTVNLIDTPGHPDFISEVERVLGVLDSVVLVISAVEGVQAQTRVLMRTLQRLRIPTLIFVNKVDRVGARSAELVPVIADRLGQPVVPMDTVTGIGTADASVRPTPPDDPGLLAQLVDVLAAHDETVLAEYVEHPDRLSPARLQDTLAEQTRRAVVSPVFFGSALTGAGIGELVAGAARLLPAANPDRDGPPVGTVFAVRRGPAGERLAYLRLFGGTLNVRDRWPTVDGPDRVTGLGVFAHGGVVPAVSACAGQIATVTGLGDVRIGDAIGGLARPTGGGQFAPPGLETVVLPARPRDKGRLYAALAQLAEQDPLIRLRQDDLRRELSVSLYGEVQKEVVQATLAEEYGLDVTFRETTTVCIERVSGTGAAVEFKSAGDNPFLATVGLRVEPGALGSGIGYRLEVELGSMPPAFFTAVEDTVRETLTQGLHGWQVTDCAVLLTHTGYSPRQSAMHATFDKSMSSTARDFRQLTPLVLMAALQRARTVVCEPIERFRLEFPADLLDAVLPVLARVSAVPAGPVLHGSAWLLEGDIPLARVHELRQRLPGATRGEGLLECEFDRYQPVRGTPPARSRSDLDPLNRAEYLQRLEGRLPRVPG